MKLITISDYQLKVTDEALLIRPIRRLWNQDRSERKEKFYQQISYMYFMVSPASSYSYIIDEEERRQTVIEQEGLPSDFTPSSFLKEAMEIYKKLSITPSQRLLEDAIIGADKVGKFLRNVDLEDVDDKGRPKYQVSQITAALKNVEGIVTSLQNLQKKVDQELQEQGSARGTQELTVLELEDD